jgi:hypothetical protein
VKEAEEERKWFGIIIEKDIFNAMMKTESPLHLRLLLQRLMNEQQ